MKFLKTINTKLFAEGAPAGQLPRTSYYPALDGLRAIAIMIVLLVHIGINKYLLTCGISLDSNTGVHIFFVISGFLITTLLLNERSNTGRISLSKFYLRRALRILPAAYLFLIVLFLLKSIYQLRVSTADFLASFLFYKNLPMPNEPYTAHYWTLAVEVQFYLTFPLLLAYSVKRYIQLVLTIVTVVPLICIMNYADAGALQNNPIGQAVAKVCQYMFWKEPVIILIGSVFAIMLFKGLITFGKVKLNYFLSFALLVLAIVVSSAKFVFYSSYISAYIAAMLVGFAMVITILQQDFLAALLTNNILRRLGILSYSIYLWQELFIGTRAWQPWLHTFSGWPVWMMMLLKLAIIMALAAISYKLEALFLKIKIKYSNNTSAPR